MIDIKGLTKTFDTTKAVDGISLEIGEGEVFGFLGPNGAGKTTLLSMLCTLISPDGGSVDVIGLDASKHAKEIRKSIGIVFQDQSLDGNLTGRENLEVSAALYGVPKDVRKQQIDSVLDVIGLKDRADALVRTYSMGMRRRLEVARALIHGPKILFLDEPTLGLDPQVRERVWGHLLSLNKDEGTTIILATNYMEEAEKLCNRVGIMDAGRMIKVGTPGELKGGLAGDVITLKTKKPGEAREKFQGVDFIKETKLIRGKIFFIVDKGEAAVPRIVEIAGSENIDSIELHRPTLNDVFLQLTGKEIKKEGEDGPVKMRMKGKRRGRP